MKKLLSLLSLLSLLYLPAIADAYILAATLGSGSTGSTGGTSGALTRTASGKLFYDNFDDNSLNAWWTNVSNQGTNTESGGVLTMTRDAVNAAFLKATFTANTGAYITAMSKVYANGEMRLYVLNGDFNNHYQLTVEGQSNAKNALVKRVSGSDTSTNDTTYTSDNSNFHNYALKIASGSVTAFRDGTNWLTFSDSTVSTFSEIRLMASGAASGNGGVFDTVTVSKSAIITVSNVPSGKVVRIGGAGASSKVATSTGTGTPVQVDCSGMMFPQTTVEILSAGGTATTGTIEQTLTLSNDVWGGDSYALN